MIEPVTTAEGDILTHFILNELSATVYWKSPISILVMSGYVTEIFLEQNS